MIGKSTYWNLKAS